MLVQFAVSIFMIVGTTIVYKQIDHMKSRDLGFDRENIVHIYTGDSLRGRIESIKRRLLQYPGVIGVTATNVPPVWRETNAGAGDVHWEGKQAGQRVPVHVMAVDYDYLETFKMEMAAGRFLSRDYSTDATDGFVVNEAAVRAMGMDSPVGKRFSVWDDKGRIVGVVKDFHFRSLHDEIEPLAMKILREATAREPGHEAVLLGLLVELMVFLSRRYGESEAGESRALLRMGHLVSTLEQRYAEPWTLESLAAAARLSRTGFLRVFRQATGQSPVAFLIGLRIEAAKRLLRQTRRSMTQIAHDCGFGDSNYFARKFREATGHTPTGFRRGTSE